MVLGPGEVGCLASKVKGKEILFRLLFHLSIILKNNNNEKTPRPTKTSFF